MVNDDKQNSECRFGRSECVYITVGTFGSRSPTYSVGEGALDR